MPRFRSSSHPPAPSAPLSVLADLQEFGVLGYSGLVPSVGTTAATTTTTSSATSSSYRRFSSMSMMSVLSFRDDAKSWVSTPMTPVRASPSAGQQGPMPGPHRMDSFSTLLSPDWLLNNEAISFQNLPIPRRSPVASPDSPPLPPTSRCNQRILPPLSSSTEQDWLALTAVMGPPPRKPLPNALKGLGSSSDMFAGEIAPRGMIRDLLASVPTSVPTQSSEWRSGSPCRDVPVLSPPQQTQSPRPHCRVPFVPSVDSPLSSSTSSSCLHTPSLWCGSSSSSTNIASPPVTSASTSSSPPPHDTADRCSKGKLRGIAKESLFAEDATNNDYLHTRRSAHDTETIRLEGLLDKKQDSPSPPPPPCSSQRPPRVELSFILDGGLPPLRCESLVLSSNWHNSESPGPSKLTTDLDSGSIPPPRPARRPPPLQLASNCPPSSSASRAPAGSGEAFGVQSVPQSQPRFAHAFPSRSHLPASSLKSRRSSIILIEDVLEDAQQLLVGRETHSSSSRSRSPGSSDSPSPYYHGHDHDPANDPEEGSQYTPRTPEFARPSAEYSPESIEFTKLSVDSPPPNNPSLASPPRSKPSRSLSCRARRDPEHDDTWPGMRKWRSQTPLHTPSSRLSPSGALVPLSPVVSFRSDHSVACSIRSGITRLLSIGTGGRSRSTSKSREPSSSMRSSASFDRSLPLSTAASLRSFGTSVNANPSTGQTEARRLRKEGAQARAGRLAQELTEKAHRGADVDKTRKVAYVQEKSLRPWEEMGAMYQGLSYL